jgi:asparagine synthase (glutamine-hydrolysing)
MGQILAHRGPDGSGLYLDGPIGLVNRRLGILDVSSAGDQPMTLSEGNLWLTYNGEIHNYLELRRELESGGAEFRTGTDTEVVLQAYARWGCDCFERFNGMWALALWDARRRRLVLSRDRFGVKPLYYSVRGERICFASEAKAILAAFPEERAPDTAEVEGFVAGRPTDLGRRTFFANVTTLAPATNLVCSPESMRASAYWGFVPGVEASRPDAEDQFRTLLTDAVRLRTRSDVPIGACLSGGLDSSAIVALLDRSAEPLPCFSLHYDDPSFDESRYAALAARDRDVVMHWVRPDPAALVQTMRKITWHRDGPSRMRGCGQWFVMGEAGRHVKVVIDGQGGDELLAGYAHYVFPYLIDRLRRGVPDARRSGPLLREIFELGELETPRPWFLLASPMRYLRRSRAGIDRPYASAVNNMLWNELRINGLPEVLHDEDALSMAFSVESRTPFLDHRLVEFCFSLPFHDKISDGWTKSLLRRSLDGLVPGEILARRRKLGFSAPVASWLRAEGNRQAVYELLLDPRSVGRGTVEPGQLERDLKGFYERRSIYPSQSARRLWRWITLELWFRDFVDGDGF